MDYRKAACFIIYALAVFVAVLRGGVELLLVKETFSEVYHYYLKKQVEKF